LIRELVKKKNLIRVHLNGIDNWGQWIILHYRW